MKSLVIFYSYEGNTKFVAQTIGKTINAELLEIHPIIDYKEKGMMKYLWLWKEAMMKKTPELEPIEKRFDDYDLIFIWTPIWAFSMTPPIRSFLQKYNIKNKKIIIFCTSEGGKWKYFEHIKELIPDNEFLAEKEFARVSKNKEKIEQEAKDWANSFII